METPEKIRALTSFNVRSRNSMTIGLRFDREVGKAVLAALPPGKSPRYPLGRRLDGPQSRSGHYEEEKNLSPTGNRTPAVQPVAIPTEPSRLLFDRNDENSMITKWNIHYLLKS
jgi:hypothetical protein